MDRLAVVGEPSEEKRHHYLQRLWYGFAAVVIAFLGGHSYSEMLIVPHIKEFGGEFGPDEAGVWPDLDNDNRCTSKSFVELLREMGAGLGERHTLDGVLRFLPGKETCSYRRRYCWQLWYTCRQELVQSFRE